MTIVIDIDGVVCRPDSQPYRDRLPYPEAVRCLRLLKQAGHTLVYCTARYMGRYGQNQEKAREAGLKELRDWLNQHEIPFDEVFLGKPSGDLYVDDRAFRLVSDNGSGDWNRLLDHVGAGELNQISVGDVVELKSGGPPMTVTAIVNNTLTLTCFNQDGDLDEITMPAGCVSVTERRWEGFYEEDVSRATAGDDEDDDEDD